MSYRWPMPMHMEPLLGQGQKSRASRWMRLNLLLVDQGENQLKGAKGPSGYLPRKEYQCDYVKKWQLVATKYKLELPVTDRRVLLSISTECTGL